MATKQFTIRIVINPARNKMAHSNNIHPVLRRTVLSKRMRTFIDVATTLSFTKSSENLSMTQPAVSFQVKQLEEELNCVLFLRKSNKVQLTEVGFALKQFCTDVEALILEKSGIIQHEVGSDISTFLFSELEPSARKKAIKSTEVFLGTATITGLLSGTLNSVDIDTRFTELTFNRYGDIVS